MIWNCSTGILNCEFWQWLYDFQTLVAGTLAVAAAAAGIWAPIYLHIRGERDRQIARINAITLHVTALGVHAARWVQLLKLAYFKGDRENVTELALPNLRRDVSRLNSAIDVAHDSVTGPDSHALALILWRITNMRLAADNAGDLANVVEINLTGSTKRDIEPREFDEIEEHLLGSMTTELPKELGTIG